MKNSIKEQSEKIRCAGQNVKMSADDLNRAYNNVVSCLKQVQSSVGKLTDSTAKQYAGRAIVALDNAIEFLEDAIQTEELK